ncbi:hypothetical protein GGR28_002327 [Lewinella aquimaris]|uniref:Baseplate J-like protein n=1 Tax=Neolewinella aquimaris TaxID=1835722 RepID=A0A840E7J1_9BACT|nr:hypothetical protein [Neolewinella aquimaris]MBB4079702.1 hypothetical protein [Neolewinella aquimaris]
MSQHFRQVDHPLRRGGLSRPERDNPALDAATAPVDGRGLGDLLRFWYDYARQVNFYSATKGGTDPAVTGDWLDFFRRSIPFQYATIGAFDLEALEDRFRAIYASIETRRTLVSLNPLLDLLLEMAGQLATWKADLAGDVAGLSAIIQGLIDSSLGEPVERLVGLVNGASKWGYRSSMPLGDIGAAFGLPLTATFAVDRSISGRRGSPKNKVLAGRDELAELYRVLWQALEATVDAARDDGRLEDSLRNPASAGTPPSLGLVFSFLLLFRDAQGGLNKLSGKHLDFFYRKTLQLKELPLVNDRAHLIFELGKRVEDSLVLAQGLRFRAGKDAAGQEILFELPEDTVLTKTQVAEVRTLYLDPEKVEDGDIYAAPVANSGDGLGDKFPKGAPPAWPTLGAAAATYTDPETELTTTLPIAEFGLLLASPVFLLKEGKRKVTVTIILGPSVAEEEQFRAVFAGEVVDVFSFEPARGLLAEDYSALFLPYLTTEKEWLPVTGMTVSIGANYPAKELALTLNFTLEPDFPAVLHPELGVLSVAIPGAYPALRLDLNPAQPHRRAWYCHLGQLPVKSVSVTATVCGLRQLAVQNDLATIDPAKPFQPFGPLPKANSSNFYVGSEEVFAKRWTRLDLRLAWLDLPDFTGYYDFYPDPPFVAADVEATVSVRSDFNWVDDPDNSHPLITAGTEVPLTECDALLDDEFLLSLGNSTPLPPCTWPFTLPENISSAASCGVLRLRLGAQDFLHDRFSQAILNVAAENERIVKWNADNEDDDDYPKPLVVINPPYTPTLAGVSIDYQAADSLDDDLRVVHLHPWQGSYAWQGGGAAGAMNATEAMFPLLPTFPHEGHLFLGLSDYQPGELLNLYFELDAPTADPRLEKAEVRWAYLRGNEWIDLLDELQVLADTTDGLLKPGIVRIAVPSAISRAGTTILNPQLHWLRVSVPERSAAVASALLVSTQSAEVVAVTQETNDATRLAEALPAETIAKVLTPVGDLKGLLQPYPSFGGRAPEPSERFDRRVSELLRHKGRAITLNDYESIVLEAFPRVYRVKCLPHTLGVRGDATSDLELAPGYVTLVVIPDVAQVSAVNPFEPRLPAAELEAIREYFLDKISPCVRLHVLNPEYETVRLTLCVRFHPGKSAAFYKKQLQLDLRELLAPWTRAEAGADISFGGRFYYSTAVHFVEELDYVDFVRDLRILDPDTGEPVTYQAARRARSVLTTVNGTTAADTHQIIVLED